MPLKEPWQFENPSCAGIGVDLFYRNDHDEVNSFSKIEEKQIISICKSCPCQIECAEWAIHKEKWGVWGGLTPIDRKNIRRSRRRKNKKSTKNINLLP